MTHAEFVAAFQRGELQVEMDAKAAARFLSARLLLPFVLMPVLGIGVALTLIGWIYTGLATIGLAIAARYLIRRGAGHFVLTQALQDAALYEEATKSGVMRVTPA